VCGNTVHGVGAMNLHQSADVAEGHVDGVLREVPVDGVGVEEIAGLVCRGTQPIPKPTYANGMATWGMKAVPKKSDVLSSTTSLR